MQGHNVMILNHATLVEAIEEHLNRILYSSEAVRVEQLKPLKMPGGYEYRVNIMSRKSIKKAEEPTHDTVSHDQPNGQ